MIYIYIYPFHNIYIHTYLWSHVWAGPQYALLVWELYIWYVLYIYICVIHQDFWLHEIEDARRVLAPLRRGKSWLRKSKRKGGAYFSRLWQYYLYRIDSDLWYLVIFASAWENVWAFSLFLALMVEDDATPRVASCRDRFRGGQVC